MRMQPILKPAFLFLSCILVMARFTAGIQAGEAVKTRTLADDLRLVSEVMDSVERIEAVIKLDEASPFWSAKVDRQLTVFRNTRQALSQSMDRPAKDDIWTVMRIRKESFGAGGEAWTGLGTPFANARDTLMEFANHPEIQALLLAALDNRDSAVAAITKPIADVHLIQLRTGIERNGEKLRRYKIKYGPTSARLNLLETGLNYWALQAVPGIRSSDQGPGHLEVIASYTTSYLILLKSDAGDFTSSPTLTSVFEGGFRYYIFRPGWGQEGVVNRILRPSYLTFGGLFGDREDGFLRLPIEEGFRWGLFGSWGDVKLALNGLNDWDTSQILISRQFQFIPYFF